MTAGTESLLIKL